MQSVLGMVKSLCVKRPTGVSGTEVAAMMPNGNAQIFYALKALTAEGDLVEERGVREDLHSNSMCFRPVQESAE